VLIYLRLRFTQSFSCGHFSPVEEKGSKSKKLWLFQKLAEVHAFSAWSKFQSNSEGDTHYARINDILVQANYSSREGPTKLLDFGNVIKLDTQDLLSESIRVLQTNYPSTLLHSYWNSWDPILFRVLYRFCRQEPRQDNFFSLTGQQNKFVANLLALLLFGSV
jgi:hypothetical protein